MEKDKFEKAIELNKEIEELKSHKIALENSMIRYGGGLILHIIECTMMYH